MATVIPYHTDSCEYPRKHREVYHDKDICPDGERIKAEHKLKGMRNKKRCLKCNKVS
jgi:hypothetical protein